MKLLQHTGRYFLFFAFLALPATAGLLYLALCHIVDAEQDELMRESAADLVRHWSAHGLPSDTLLALAGDMIRIHPATTVLAEPVFCDTSLWNADEGESEPVRFYRFTTPAVGGRRYDVAMSHSVLDSEELLFSALVALIGLVVLLLAAVLWFNRFVARRLWQPFHDTLAALAGFNFSGQTALALPEDTAVAEFNALNRAANAMTRRIATDYHAMLAFTGNAAHEIQTPLAVIQSQAERLLQNDKLDEATLSAVAGIHGAAYRLSRLNRALLFLHKIENQQFRETAQVDLKSQIEEKLAAFADAMAARGLHLFCELATVTLPLHPALADALIGNLLGNAIKHNLGAEGRIEISLTRARLRIRNTGAPLAVPPAQLFERFRKAEPAVGDSPGLGLSVVQEICRFYGFGAIYRFEEGWHEMTIRFAAV